MTTVTRRPLGEAELKTLRRMAAEGATLASMASTLGMRMSDVEAEILRHGIVRAARPATSNGSTPLVHRKRDWVVVERFGGGGGEAYVSYAPSTRKLAISRMARELLGNPGHVVLLWEPQARLLGIRAATKGERGARSLVHPQVSAHSIDREAGLVKRRYPARLEDGVLVIAVDEEPER